MKFEITILGVNAAYPAHGRIPTAQFLNIHEKCYLIDCAEGTQARMSAYKVKRSKINHIFISHMHGDHILGLPGLLGSLALQGRTEPLHIFCPFGLKEFMEAHLKYSYIEETAFPIHYTVLNPNKSELIFENEEITVHTIPLYHNIPTTGFLFKEKPAPRKMRKEKIKAYNIPFQSINGIKMGNDFTLANGKVIPNSELTLAPPPPRSYAFCSDTAYNEKILPLIEGVDLLYHEATFGHDLVEQVAEYPYHSTTVQAGTIALKAKVKRLLIGHFSPRYVNLKPLLAETRTVFEQSDLALEGMTFKILRSK